MPSSGAGNRAQRLGQLGGVVFFQDNLQIFGNGLVAVQMLRHIELGQGGNVDFLGHDFIPSKVLGQGDGRRNIRLLGGFVAATEHHIFQAEQPMRKFRELSVGKQRLL
jgi:hypothetical protein